MRCWGRSLRPSLETLLSREDNAPAGRIGRMDLRDARRRIHEHANLNAFISLSAETGGGPIVAVKDLVDVAGMVTTAGGIILPDVPAPDDAPVVKHIRTHGCVVVGKANLHEFA